MLISPLAVKLCAARGIDPASLRGSGPRGRVMAADVPAEPPAAEQAASAPRRALHLLHPTRAQKEGYCVYDAEVDMSALAGISLPIAVQCEKLLERRYSLFDYIVRAVVRACTGAAEWQPAAVNVLLFENRGQEVTALPNAADKTIYRLARESAACAQPPADYRPNIVVCDALTTRAQVAAYLGPEVRPDFAFVARGGSPKVGIRAGREQLADYMLSYTFYAADTAAIPHEVANRIAAALQDYLVNPVRLLLLK